MSIKFRKRGQYWHARIPVPVRRKGGSLTTKRIERSTKSGNKRRAREAALQVQREYWQRAYRGPEPGETFAEAALIYMETTGQTRHMEPLLRYFTTTPCHEIDQDALIGACKALYPGCKPATWNRNVFTPVSAILRLHAKSRKRPPPIFERPRGHDALPPLRTPDDDWFDTVLPEAPPDLCGLILFLSIQGRRVGEAISIRSEFVNEEFGVAVIDKAKDGKPISVNIPDVVFEVMADWRGRELFFGYETRQKVNDDLVALAARLRIQHFSSHKLGRHTFAKRVLAKGHSLKFLKEAGHWATITMPAKRYGHLERSEVDEAVREMGHIWGKKRKTGNK